jgi:hypothetical protein
MGVQVRLLPPAPDRGEPRGAASVQHGMRRLIVVCALVALVGVAMVSRTRVVESGDVVTMARETVDWGEHVVTVLDRGARVAYAVQRGVSGEAVTAEQRSGRAIYRVRGGAIVVRSAGGVIEIEGDAVIVVDGARYAVAEGTVSARALSEDPSLLRWLDEVNDAPGGDLVERLGELERMRASLRMNASR